LRVKREIIEAIKLFKMSNAAEDSKEAVPHTASAPVTALPPMAAPSSTEDEEVVAARDRLNALLDNIDTNKRKREGDDEAPTCAGAAVASTPYEWRKIFDPASKNYYYHNHRTGVTQWDRPEAFVDAPKDVSADYTAVASFSSKNGAFASGGTDTYWDQVSNCDSYVKE